MSDSMYCFCEIGSVIKRYQKIIYNSISSQMENFIPMVIDLWGSLHGDNAVLHVCLSPC